MEQFAVESHRLLDLRAFVTEFPRSLTEMKADTELQQLLTLDAAASLRRSEDIRSAVRDLLRHDGFKPTGRNKPAAEYLFKAAHDGFLAPIRQSLAP